MTENFKGFIYEKDADGIVTLTMDMAGPVNAMNADFREAILWLADKLEAEEGLKGVVLASAKKTFFAGGDLKEMEQAIPGTEQQWFDKIEKLKLQLRRIEKLPIPVVAAINGAALGGGLELCLACDHRIAWNSPKVVLGFPEVTLGLLPGAGGVVRTIHKLGLDRALPLLLEGKRYNAKKAMELGLVDAVIENEGELVSVAKQWIKKNSHAGVKPWDLRGYKLLPAASTLSMLNVANAHYFAKHRGLLPAPARILSIAHDVYCVNVDTALRIETRGLIEMIMSPEAKNQINSNFFQLNKVNSGANRPKDLEKSVVSKVGIIGAGMMGQAIAHNCTMSGLDVLLMDASLETAQNGNAYSKKLLEKIPAKVMNNADKQAVLERITAVATVEELSGCDLIIEAVFEDAEIKRQVIKAVEPLLEGNTILATNSSSLPITLLAENSAKADKVIGMHFFSPADRMPLVEITCGEQTSDDTLARAFDFARQIGKTPIVVNDSPGFFTTRVFNTYIDEGCRLLKEGIEPAFIENMGRYIGMPVGPLAIHDEVGQNLVRKITQAHKELGVETKSDASFAAELAETLINDYGRGGRHHGGGFYEYSEFGAKKIWPKLVELYTKSGAEISEQDAKDRLLFRQVIASLKCLESGVLRSVADGNIGSLMGIGAPTWTGGFIQFVNTYGLQRFIDRCDELATTYGERFRAPEIVSKKIAAGELFE